ncbi:D-alanyl-D-alanine carboxypeptidase family protein [Nocardia takedensis]
MTIFATVLRATVSAVVLATAPQMATAVAEPAPIQLPWQSPGPGGVRATAAQLAEGFTGAMLWSREPHTRLPIASLTKVMTAVVVLDANDPDRPITVPAEAVAYCARHDGSTAGLTPGEVLSARQLLYALLLPSGCDAAFTLADAFGPGYDGFVAKMNDTARRMGLTESGFADPSGLPTPTDYSTYSTVSDLVRLGMRAMAMPAFRETVASPTHHVPAGPANREHFWETTNLLLGDYPGTVGIKTGFTDAAGTCLLFETVRAGIPLIGVVLHSAPNSDLAAKDDAERMLNWGYGPILSALPIG